MEGGYNLGGLSLGSAGRSRKGKKSGGGGGGGGSEKPVKQPQRGLGVAQLEKIRLQSQMGEYVNSSSSSFHSDLDLDDPKVDMMMRSSSSAAPSSSSSNMGSASSSLFSLHHHHPPRSMMGYGDGERRSFNYGDQYWPNYSSTRGQHQESASFSYYAPPTAVTLPLFEQSVEQDQSTATQKRRSQHDRSSSMGSISTAQMNIYSDSNEQEEEVDLELRLSL